MLIQVKYHIPTIFKKKKKSQVTYLERITIITIILKLHKKWRSIVLCANILKRDSFFFVKIKILLLNDVKINSYIKLN